MVFVKLSKRGANGPSDCVGRSERFGCSPRAGLVGGGRPLTGVDTVASAIEVEAVPVLGNLSVISEAPVEAEYSGREYGAGRSDIS